MTRLKYFNTDDLLYTDWFTIGPNLVIRAIINIKTHTYQIIEFDSEMVLEGKAKNLRQAKDKVKTELVKCGVVFDGEIRRRT
jgi:hypothetical protein